MTVKERKRNLSNAFNSPSKLKSMENLSDDMFFDYNGDGDQDELANPRSKEPLDEKSSRDFLKFFAETFEVEAVRSGAKALAAQHPELLKQFEAQAQPDVPMWTDRKDIDASLTPPQWVERFYGTQGVRMADLTRDQPLYNAYLYWVKKHPGDDLHLPKETRRKDQTPADARERKKAYDRAYRQRQRASI